jgi:hypothetical protein
MAKKLDYYAGFASEMLTNDEVRDSLFWDIKQAVECKFAVPSELQALTWIGNRKFASTAVADARNAATRTFAANLPNIQIAPLSEEPPEYERTERLEQIMTWEYERLNRSGTKSPHWRIVEDAVTYHAVAFQTEYLPYKFKGVKKTPQIKAMLRSRNFNWIRHDPAVVHTRESANGVECVMKAASYTAQELVDEFGRENPGVREIISKYDDPSVMMTTYYTLYDWMDWEYRCQWAEESGGSGTIDRDPSGQGIVFRNEEHGLPFIPWVVVDNGDPLWKSVFTSGLWENLNVLRTLQFAKALDQVAHSTMVIQTPDGTLQRVWMDYSNPSQPIVTPLDGTTVQNFPPPQLDPQMSAILGQAESEIYQSTTSRILADVSRYADATAFSTVNAMLSAAVAQLALSQTTAEKALGEGVFQNFSWLDHADIPLVSYRQQTLDEARPELRRGAEMVVRKEDFDLEALYITAKLKPSTASDEQAQLNGAVVAVERLGMAKEMAWEKLGYTNYPLNVQKKAQETITEATIQAEAQRILMQPQLEAQQMQMQQQAEMQQQQMAAQQQQVAPENMTGEMNGETGFETAQGFDNRGGGFAPQGASPGLGREQIMNETQTGQEMV